MSFFKRPIFKYFLVLLYFPMIFCVIGWMAYRMRAPSPVEGRYLFKDVFLYYGHPLNPEFLRIHIPVLVFSLAFLVLLVTLSSTPKPLLTTTQVRILLLVLIVLVTLIVHLLHQLGLSPSLRLFPRWKVAFRDVFLYIDMHLVLLYLLTYVPFFRISGSPGKMLA